MIGRIKNLSRLSEKVDDLKSTFEGLSGEVGRHKEEVTGLRSDIDGLKKFQEEHSVVLDRLNEQRTRYDDLIAELQKEVYDFKVLKSQMQRSITERFNSELSKCLDEQKEQIKGDVTHYNNLRKDLEVVSSRLAALTDEVEKFRNISCTIKEQDFHLVRHKKNLDAMDREKLALMKKIDNLERMVAKLRRR